MDENKEKLVTVYKTGHHGIIAVIKSILDEAGIKYFAKGEGVQDLIGVGVFGMGYNTLTGPVEIQVLEEEAEYAKELLAGIEDAPEENIGEPNTPEQI
jgi:hypothetical protein